MEIKVVAVERDDSVEKTVFGSSGIMIDNKYVLCTANVFFPIFNDYFLENWQSVTPGKLHSLSLIKNLPEVRIICNNNIGYAKYEIRKGQVFAFLLSKDLKSTVERALDGWAVDTIENFKELEIILSLFVVIKIESNNISDFAELLKQWWHLIENENFIKSEEILIKSVPFGNKFFLDSFSKGIISNIVGANSSLIVSDCPCTPGSEGSPVFKANSGSNVPVGIVISSSCWWRKEWTGLTLIVDMRSILLELLENYHYKPKFKNISHQFIESVESSLVQLYCGSQRGTAILIDAKIGILLTNSHVVSGGREIHIFWKDQKGSATLLYRTPDNQIYDLAVLKCNSSFLKVNDLHSVEVSKEPVNIGDQVISVGFAIFSKDINSNPTFSRGFVIQCNESMITTSCCVNPGMSGGAILNKNGALIGVIVCNTKVQDIVYPHLNMGVPYATIGKTMQQFLESKDTAFLRRLTTDDPNLISAWKYLEAKL